MKLEQEARMEECKAGLRGALQLVLSSRGDLTHEETTQLRLMLAEILSRADMPAEYLALHKAMFEDSVSINGPENRTTLEERARLGIAMRRLVLEFGYTNTDEFIGFMRESMEVCNRVLSPEHEFAYSLLNNLLEVTMFLAEKTPSLYTEIEETCRAVLRDHTDDRSRVSKRVLIAQLFLSRVYQAQGKTDDADEMQQVNVDMRRTDVERDFAEIIQEEDATAQSETLDTEETCVPLPRDIRKDVDKLVVRRRGATKRAFSFFLLVLPMVS